jgi:4-amino-4-deoxy-L-arabinose transferase-like glycosyltransferase
VPELFALLTFPAAAVLLARRVARHTAVEFLCVAYVSLLALVVASGYVLSWRGALGSVVAWAVCGIAAAAAAGLIAAAGTAPPRRPLMAAAADALRDLRRDRLLSLLALAVGATGAANLILIVATAPGGWDALSYHLPKMALAIQHGAFRAVPANFWAQEVHPDNSTALLVYGYLATGRNDHLVALWQYLSYWIAIAATFGIAREAGARREQALFGALVFALTTSVLMQSTYCGNDLVLSALAGSCAYGLMLGVRSRSSATLWPAGAALGLALGTKAIFLLTLPPLAVLFLSLLRRTAPRDRMRITAVAAAAALAGTCVFALPAGYVSNARRWGNPILGPRTVVERHTLSGQSFESRAANGVRNTLRYLFDFISVDGLPRIAPVFALQRDVRAPFVAAAEAAGAGLERMDGAEAAFRYERLISAHESHAFWGVLGFLVLWPLAFISAWRLRGVPAALAIAAASFLPLFAMAIRYAPWHGRFFVTAGMLAAAAAAFGYRQGRLRSYLWGCAILGCASAASAVLLRGNSPLVGASYSGVHRPSILTRDRIAQLTRNNPRMAAPFRAYEEAVPAGSSVAVRIQPEWFEYPFYGEGLSRRIAPMPPGATIPDPAPDYYVFDETLERIGTGDVPLGEGWWLRKLPPQ